MVDEANSASHSLALLRKVDERTERMGEDLRDLKVACRASKPILPP